MRIVLIYVGKTNKECFRDAINIYLDKIKYYNKLDVIEIKTINKKNFSKIDVCKREGKLITAQINHSDHVVLLDDKGVSYTSKGFASKLERWMVLSKKRLVFVIGGPYGFSDLVCSRADEKLSFSRMTFSHQMIRLFFLEQLYRAYSIINKQPYHHE